MMTTGNIQLHRQLFDSRLWSLPPDHTRLAIYLMLSARFMPKPKKLADVTVRRGEVVTSLKDISDDCEWYENRKLRVWSRQKVSRLLEDLTNIGFLTLNSDTYGTHITICNYETYQPRQQYNPDSHGTPADTRVHIEEGKKGKKGKKREEEEPPIVPQGTGDNVPAGSEKPKEKKKAPGERAELERQIAEIWKAYPKKVGKPKGTEAIAKALKTETFAFLLERTQTYAAAVRRWPRGNDHFIKHPQGWFNDERYHDDEAAWERSSGDGDRSMT